MEIGCHLPTQGPLATREAVETFARESEQRQVASLWVSDHVIFPRTATGSYPGGRFPHPPDKAYLDPVITLAAAAMCTTRARLGASVFVLGHRHPIVMAKMLATIEALSQGRLIVGVGVGWWKEELEMLGAPFHARGRQADEMLRVFKALWTEDNPNFQGEFYKIQNLGFAPKPKPLPPIWVGGDKAGRRLETIELSLRLSLTDDLLGKGPQAVVDLLGEYQRLGLAHVVLEFRRDDLKRMLEILDVVTRSIRPAFARA